MTTIGNHNTMQIFIDLQAPKHKIDIVKMVGYGKIVVVVLMSTLIIDSFHTNLITSSSFLLPLFYSLQNNLS